MLDFDNGIISQEKLIEIQNNDLDFDSHVFSSQNHQKAKGPNEPACDRLRLLIPLANPITEREDLELVKEHILEKFSLYGENVLDQKFLDRNRYFAHGTTAVSSFSAKHGPLD